jgi:hypothetical protein
MKSKVLFGLFAALLVLALAPNSFAQIQVSLINSASAGEVATSHHAQTSDPDSPGSGILISGAFLAQADLTTTFLTLTFPSAITSAPDPTEYDPAGGGDADQAAVPSAGDGIRLSGGSGLFASITGIWTIDFEGGEIVILLPGANDNTASGSISVLGVRIDADDLSGAGPFEVNGALSSSANGYLPTDMDADIITALGAGFTAAIGAIDGETNEGTFTVFSNRDVGDGTATVLFSEPFDSAWRSAAQHSTGGGTTNIDGTRIRFTFANVPSGVTLNLAVVEDGDDLTITLADTTITSADLESEIEVTGSDLDGAEEFHLEITVTDPITPGASFSAANITMTSTLIPIGDALDEDDLPTNEGGFPRFEQLDTTVTVGTIIAPTTTLLIPYFVVDNSILYDTGIALANTTEDPFTTGSATPAAGSIRVDVFPRTATGPGTPFGFTTSASERPGAGLSTDGTLAAGSTWTVLVSTIMAQEGVSSPQTGYIFLQANFLNAHGITFISDFGAGPFNFTSFSPMLVLESPTSVSRANETGLSF